MTRLYPVTLVFLGAALACTTPPPTVEPTELVAVDGLQVLVFSKTAGYRHQSIEPGQAMFAAMAAEHDFDVVASEDATLFASDSLFTFDVVVFLNTTGDVLDSLQQHRFVQFIRFGGGYVGLHAASDTEFSWPWYGRLVGGYFNGHPPVQQATLTVDTPRHPATAHLPDPWIRTDEWYDIRDFNPDVQVLVRIDETSYKPADQQPVTDRPIAWFHEYEGGKAFYTGLGHTTESYSDSLFIQHVWGGLTMVRP